MLDRRIPDIPIELPGGLDDRFCEVMDAAPVMIWVSGTDTGRVWFNRPWLLYTGRSMAQELGGGWTQGIHRDDYENCLKIYTDHFVARREFRVEYRLRCQDGTYHWIDDAGTPRYAHDGTFLGFIGSCTDVSHLRNAEAALRESELRLRFALEAAQMGTFEADIAATEARIDAQAARLLGLPESTRDVGVDQLRMRVPFEDLQASDAKQKRLTEMGEAYRHEFRLALPDGSVRWLRAHADVRSNRIFGVNFDITHQKAAEIALQQSQARLRIATSGAALGVFEWDPQSDHVVWENDRVYEIFGLSSADRPINKQEFVEKYLHPADAPAFEMALNQAMFNMGGFHTVCRIRRSGGRRWLQIDGKFELSASGNVRLLAVIADITERKQLEARAAKLSERLMTTQEEERRNIAQELHDSTVQHLVAASLGLMNLRTVEHSGYQEHWDAINASLAEAMKELRTFTYLLVPPALALRGLHDNLQQYIDGFADRTGLVVNFRTKGRAEKLSLNSMRVIFRIVQESLANVYRHASASKVSVELRRIATELHLVITDNGSGISGNPRYVERQRFRVGVGIRGMRMRLEQVGGRLRISQPAWGGTKVHAVLPVHDVASDRQD